MEKKLTLQLDRENGAAGNNRYSQNDLIIN